MITGLGLTPIVVFNVTKKTVPLLILYFGLCMIFFITLPNGLKKRKIFIIFPTAQFVSETQHDAIIAP